MLVITAQEEEEEDEGEERLHEFRSLVKLGSRGVALCDDKQSRAAFSRPFTGQCAARDLTEVCVESMFRRLLSIVQHANL